MREKKSDCSCLEGERVTEENITSEEKGAEMGFPQNRGRKNLRGRSG